MKTTLLVPVVSLAFAILTSSFTAAATVSRTFKGVIDINWAEGAITKEFPVGTPWKAELEWESTSAPLFLGETQVQYRLTKFTFTLQGPKGKWTTSARPEKASFGFSYIGGGLQHEMQFTSGLGPSGHTNPNIANYQPYSINIVLTDPTGTAISSLESAAASFNPADWSAEGSYFKLYLNNDGNRYIQGPINLPVANEAEISVQQPAGSELVDGSSRSNFGAVKLRSRSAVKTFVIENTGKATLTNLAISKTGLRKGDFIISTLSTRTLAPGAKARFTVVFKPKGKGKRAAALRIISNDKDENPFDIPLIGIGK